MQNYCASVAVTPVCLALAMFAVTVLGQEVSDADTREVSNYRLSVPALENYTAATHALAAVMTDNRADCNESGDQSLSAMAARLDGIAGAPAALAGSGIGSREYIVFGLAVFQSGMGAWAMLEGQGELPPGVSAENVEFYQQHKLELQELSGIMPEDGCADGNHYGEDEEE